MTKLCECGCGAPAPVAPFTNAKRGMKKGQPMRFVHGHSGRMQGNIRERLLSKVLADLRGTRLVDDAPCWLWTGNAERGGYGQIGFEGRTAYVHRVAYEMWFGPIPGALPAGKRGDGPDVDHLCRNRLCVNPAHLEAVPHRVNIRRGDSISTINAAKDRCLNGHLFDEENTYRRQGRRDCRACRRVSGGRNNAAGVRP